MSAQLITLTLTGEVTLQDFASGMEGLRRIVESLQEEQDPHARIEWVVHALQAGSATATLLGRPDGATRPGAVENVTRAYGQLGHDLQTGDLARWSPRVQQAARSVVDLVNGHVRSVRFETEEDVVEVVGVPSSPIPAQRAAPRWGAITGRVETLHRHGTLRFTLYDLVRDRAVNCYVSPGSEGLMRNIWGKLAVVEGLVFRDPTTGMAQSVRQVKTIREVQEGDREAWRQAIGASPSTPGGPNSAERIRRGRE